MSGEWARLGVRCVCIRAASACGRSWRGLAPVDGQTYIVAGYHAPGRSTGKPQAVFATLDGALLHGGNGIWVERFRPLVTKTMEQDLEQFNHLLNPSPLERLDRLMEIMNEQ